MLNHSDLICIWAIGLTLTLVHLAVTKILDDIDNILIYELSFTRVLFGFFVSCITSVIMSVFWPFTLLYKLYRKLSKSMQKT